MNKLSEQDRFDRVRELMVPIGRKYGYAPTDLTVLCLRYNLDDEIVNEKLVSIIKSLCFLSSTFYVSIDSLLITCRPGRK